MTKNMAPFHSTLIAPFYGPLMNANFLREDVPGFSETLKEVFPSFTETLLSDMVRSSWRPQKVAAWVIGLKKIGALEPDLVKQLHELKGDHAEHLVMGLVLIHSEQTAEYLETFLDSCFRRTDFSLDSLETLSKSVGWALAALEILLERTKSKETSTLRSLQSDWHRFPHQWMEQMSAAGGGNDFLERAVSSWHERDLEKHRKEVTEVLLFCEKNFGVYV